MWQLSISWPNQFRNNLTWPSNTTGISLDSRREYNKITHRYAKVSSFTWFLCWKLPIDTDFTQFICHFHQAVTWMPESFLMGQLHLSKAFWELWLSDDEPHSDYNAQWQRALCVLAVLQSSQPNPQRNEKNGKMYAIKQIKICAENQDMLPRPWLDLSGTPGVWPIGLSPGSWQTSLGLGSMSRYFAQILICIIYIHIYIRPFFHVLGFIYLEYTPGSRAWNNWYINQ